MFDRLVESEQKGTVKGRGNYFTITTFAVAAVAMSAVVASIFADDYSIGNRNIELMELLAPVEMSEQAPQPKAQPRQPAAQTQQTTTMPQRAVAIARVDDTRVVPTAVSTTPNRNLAIPEDGRFKMGPVDTDPGVSAGESDRGTPGGTGTSITGIASAPVEKDEVEATPPRIEIKKPEPPKKISLGVINGKAQSLPVPTYSAAAKAVGAQGQVAVEVTIDESGHVIAAHASGGHPLLKASAEEAARRAKFSPTFLSNVAVKVTGVIVYNFNRS